MELIGRFQNSKS